MADFLLLNAGIFLVALYAFFRKKHNSFFYIIVFLIAIAIYNNLNEQKFVMFFSIKLFSVFICLVWLQIARYSSIKNSKWFGYVSSLLLIINILEAAYLDYYNQYFMNAFNGLFLALTVIPFANKIYIDKHHLVLKWDMIYPWFIGFLIWDLTFVCHHWLDMAGLHVLALGLPLLIEKIYPGEWLQSRLYIFCFGIIIFAIFDQHMAPLYTTHWYLLEHTDVLDVIGFLWTLMLLLYIGYYTFINRAVQR